MEENRRRTGQAEGVQQAGVLVGGSGGLGVQDPGAAQLVAPRRQPQPCGDGWL